MVTQLNILKHRLAICFGGRVAEEIIFGKDNISTGLVLQVI